MKKGVLFFTIFLFFRIVGGQSVSDYLLKAQSYIKENNPGKAVEILSEAIGQKDDYRLFLLRGEAHVLNGKLSEAISDFNSANKKNPHSGDYALSRAYALKGDLSTSLYHLELSMNSDFKKDEKDILLDKAFIRMENKPEWRQFWKKEWYTELERNLSEVEFYLKSLKPENAVEILSRLEKEFPGNEDVKYAGALMNFYSRNYASSIKGLSELLSVSPDNEPYLRLLARAQTEASNPSGASATYTLLIKGEVADPDLFIRRAECYRKTGENEKALADVEKYLSFYPSDKSALRLAGKIEAASGDNLKALRYFSENLKLHPNDPECYLDRGNSYLSSKSWDWAVKDFSMALDLDPADSNTWLLKGIALIGYGKTEDACHDLKKSMSLGNKRASEYISKHCIR